MAERDARLSTTRLILVPAFFTLAVTGLRLLGELQHWPSPWFSNVAGGGGAIVGITWLPIIFGPYFAFKLTVRGERTSNLTRTFGLVVLAIILMLGGGYLVARSEINMGGMLVLGYALLLVAGLIPLAGWPALAKTLIAYGYTARIPVAIVMVFAMLGHWGTHYDAVPPNFPANAGFGMEYLVLALLPQMILWIAYTVVVGMLFGMGFIAIFRRKAAEQVPAALP